MAEAALIGAAKSVLPKLGDLALKEAIACWSARGDLEDLGDTMEMIEAVLRDAEEQQDSNHAVKLWLQRLRRALYEADDLFDEVLAHDQSRKLMGTLNKVRRLFSASNPVWLSWNVAGKIRSVRQKLDKVTADMEHFNFRKDQPAGTGAIYAGPRYGGRDETFPDALEVDIVGREADKQKILKMLCEVEESGDIPEVVAIVGVGGLGKTTLAQLVYNDNIVSENFDVKAWACVYDETNRKKVIEGKILKSIFQSCNIQPDGKPELEASFIRSIFSNKYDEVDFNKIRSSIGELLEGKKYLLVLDDVWDDNRSYWVDLFGVLRKGKRESKIVGTMRSKRVAESMGVSSSKLHILEDLETKEAERLFSSFALRPEWVGDGARTALGREIFQMLPKVPLVLRSVGSMLYSKGSLNEWEYVKNAMPQLMRLVEGENNNVLKVLKFSYDHISPHLKRCFAYCALFPKDHEFDKDSLIRLWVAQGFVQPSIAHHESLEVVGHQYFTELLNKSFFLIEQKDEWPGHTMLCHKMHDIMHELALYVSSAEVDVISDRSENMQGKSDLRHVSFDFVSPNSLKFGAARQVRSIFVSNIENFPPECVELVCINFVSLRVLDLHEFGILYLPDSVGELIHLRYLDLSKNKMIEFLPNSLTRLINLQTLNLSYCQRLRELPKRFGRLINLRHLNTVECDQLWYMPRGLGRLTSLQTFEGCVVFNTLKKWRGKKFSGIGLDALMGLSFQSQSLVVSSGGRGAKIKPVGREAEDLDSNLNDDTIEAHVKVKKLYLKLLYEDELEALQRFKIQNLEKLTISKYKAEIFPGWGRDGSMTIPPLFNNLIEIWIWDCDNLKILPPFSILPRLKVLSLEFLYDVEYIEEYSSSMSSTPQLSFFPSLEKLYIFKLGKLKEWFRFSNSSVDPSINTTTGEAQHAFTLPFFPYLSDLTIFQSPYLTTIPPVLPDVLRQVHLFGVPQCLGMELLSTSASPIAMSSSSDCSDLSLCSLVANPESFEIRGFENLNAIPEWIGNFTHLEKLEIKDCPKLTCLPKAMLNLTALRYLEINYCGDAIVEKCKETTGEYWPLIQHIPYREIRHNDNIA